MTQVPDAFDAVRCLVAPLPVTALNIIERRLAGMGLSDRIGDFEQRMRRPEPMLDWFAKYIS